MIRVNGSGARRARHGHPWIFRTDIVKSGEAGPGDLVEYVGPDGRVLGIGAWSDRARTALRGTAIPLDVDPEAGWMNLIEAAVDRRAHRGPATRLINSDSDGLPGLIVDRYGPGLSIQTITQAADRRLDLTVKYLRERLSPEVIVLRNDVSVRTHEGLEIEKRILVGDNPEVLAPIGELTLAFDLLNGQKTGGFLDQADTQLAAAQFAQGTALDCFSYDGGFALQLAAKGLDVTAIDTDEAALSRLQANAVRNGLTVKTVQANVFDFLRENADSGEQYGTIVLDPPTFAPTRKAVDAGRRAYKEINLRAFKLLASGGRLITCTRSAHMRRADFERVVAHGASDSGRWARVIERRSAAADHPTLLTAPETDYLKTLLVEVN